MDSAELDEVLSLLARTLSSAPNPSTLSALLNETNAIFALHSQLLKRKQELDERERDIRTMRDAAAAELAAAEKFRKGAQRLLCESEAAAGETRRKKNRGKSNSKTRPRSGLPNSRTPTPLSARTTHSSTTGSTVKTSLQKKQPAKRTPRKKPEKSRRREG